MQVSVFQTLADPVRLQIVETLQTGERAVNDLVAILDIHQSGVSRHLRILHDSGFVDVRPLGQKRLYSLRPEPFRELNGWLANYRRFWEARLDRFDNALRRKQEAARASRKDATP